MMRYLCSGRSDNFCSNCVLRQKVNKPRSTSYPEQETPDLDWRILVNMPINLRPKDQPSMHDRSLWFIRVLILGFCLKLMCACLDWFQEPKLLDDINLPPNYKTYRSLKVNDGTPSEWMNYLSKGIGGTMFQWLPHVLVTRISKIVLSRHTGLRSLGFSSVWKDLAGVSSRICFVQMELM